MVASMKPLIPSDAASTALAAGAVPDREDQSLHDEILTRLRDHIVEGNIPDGGRIPERQLCEMLGISRTPLREALKVLAAEGLVELLPNRGARGRAGGGFPRPPTPPISPASGSAGARRCASTRPSWTRCGAAPAASSAISCSGTCATNRPGQANV